MPRKVAKLKADAAPGGAGQQHKQEEAGQPPQQGPAAAGAPGAAAPAAGAKPKTPRKESAGARGAAAEGGPAGHHHAKLDVQEVLKRRHELLEALKLVERQVGARRCGGLGDGRGGGTCVSCCRAGGSRGGAVPHAGQHVGGVGDHGVGGPAA